MAQPYDLSGFASAEATIAQMVADQASGATKFAGGSETWAENPLGTFKAILVSGASAVATTTNNLRAALTALRMTFDLIAGGTGAVAEAAAAGAAVPSPALEAGDPRAGGPAAGGGNAAATNYDLSGIAALQATANTMMADQQSGATRFLGGPFSAILTSGGQTQSISIFDVRNRLARLRLTFDRLAQ